MTYAGHGAFPTTGQQPYGTTLKGYVDTVNAVNIQEQFGATGDGVTDDSAAFTSAMAIARRIYCPKPSSAYQLSSQVTVSNAVIEGEGAGTLFTGKGFILGDNGRLRGLHFQGANTAATYAVDFSNSATHTGWSVRDCVFEDYQQAINIRATAAGGCQEQGFILDNVFADCQNAVFATRARRIIVAGNRSTTISGTTQHYTFYGLENSQVVDNYASGGLTGILLLSRHDLNNANCGFFGNTIKGNVIEAVTEELISFDCNAINASWMNSREHDSVASTSTSGASLRVTLSSASWSGKANTYFNHWLVFYTGALAGKAYRITTEADAVFTLEITRTEWRQIAAGDLAAVGIPFFGNTIADNTLDARSSTTEAIYLYGLCVGNTVTGNICRGTGTGGIIVTSLAGGPATDVIGSNLSVFPSGGNVVQGNVAQDAEIAATYRDITGQTVFPLPANQISGNVSMNGTVLVADSFDRADNASDMTHADTGQYYDEKNGAVFGITQGQAQRVTNGTSAQNIAVINAGTADVAAEIVSTDFTTSGLALRATDGQTCFYTTDTALIRRVAGADTTIITFSSSLAAGDRLTVVCAGNEWRAYKNGLFIGSATDSASNTVTTFGPRWAASSSAKLTAFKVAPYDPTLLAALPAETSIASSTTETALFTYPLPANTLKAGTTIRVTVAMSCDVIATSGTLTIRLRYGGPSGASLAGFGIGSSASLQTGRLVFVTYELTVRTTGASGTASCLGVIRHEIGTGSQAAIGNPSNTIDTTAIKDLCFTAQWATANAGNIARAEVVSVEVIRP